MNDSHASLRRAKTGHEIMNERDEYKARLDLLDDTLGRIAEEAEHALRHPETALLVSCRIAAIVRQARGA
jgi:hypothetical protein